MYGWLEAFYNLVRYGPFDDKKLMDWIKVYNEFRNQGLFDIQNMKLDEQLSPPPGMLAAVKPSESPLPPPDLPPPSQPIQNKPLAPADAPVSNPAPLLALALGSALVLGILLNSRHSARPKRRSKDDDEEE